MFGRSMGLNLSRAFIVTVGKKDKLFCIYNKNIIIIELE